MSMRRPRIKAAAILPPKRPNREGSVAAVASKQPKLEEKSELQVKSEITPTLPSLPVTPVRDEKKPTCELKPEDKPVSVKDIKSEDKVATSTKPTSSIEEVAPKPPVQQELIDLNDNDLFKSPPVVTNLKRTESFSVPDIESEKIEDFMQKCSQGPPSPVKVRQRIRPTPFFGMRRNSTQGYGSDMEDEPRRQRHTSTSSSTGPATPQRIRGPPNFQRIRTESSCSNISDYSRDHSMKTSRKNTSLDEHSRSYAARKDFMTRFCGRKLDRTVMKMSDFIYYNPSTNPMVAADPPKELQESQTKNEIEVQPKLEIVDKVEKDKEKETNMPVPQLKLGPDGELILDEQSLVIETTAEKEARETLANTKVIYMDEFTGNNGFYRRSKRTRDWPADETIKFYRCLHTVGTDFSLMLTLFPNRSRKDLKLKKMAPLRFDGRVAVITGAGAGLGREYALLFGLRGAKVVVNDLGGSSSGQGSSQKAADVVVNEIKANGGEAVSDYNSVVEGEKIIQTALKAYGRVDILVNNAGILRDKSVVNISNDDWDLVHNVHLKGSFKTTQAAWNIFKKQNYGRIIMTSSNSGVYGNFGQANYSAAKLGLVGLANTLAIEGAKYNIHCNVIVPTAASRLTEGILPEFLFNELKPKFIAPIVAYLCHENNTDNGAIIESAAGFTAKLQIARGKGVVLRKSIEDEIITIEDVAKGWSKVTDMSKAKCMERIGGASGSLLTVLEDLKENGKQKFIVEDDFSYGSKDLILYALGIGVTVENPNDMKFLYESHPDFAPIPSFFVLPGLMLMMSSSMVASAITHAQVDFTNILHGEQYIEIVSDVPMSATLTTKGKILDVLDKKSGAVVVTQANSYDENGSLVVINQSQTFVVGAGNFNGKKTPSAEVIQTRPAPSRAPDSSMQFKTSENQAAIYRLSGDLNPLHIDPGVAILAGFKVPILHGLCSFGFSVRAVIARYANNDPSLFKAMKVRFTKPVLPGQTLKVDMWRDGNRIYFKTSVVETKADVITGAYVDLKTVIESDTTSKL